MREVTEEQWEKVKELLPPTGRPFKNLRSIWKLECDLQMFCKLV